MTLSREEIEFLKTHLEQSRQKGSEKRSQTVAPITSESLAMVVQSRGTNDPVYHAYSNGKPACGTTSEKPFRTMDMAVAEEWRKPCGWCYPERGEK